MKTNKDMCENTKNLLDSNRFFIGVPASSDMGDKFAIITLICRLTQELRQKKPDVTIKQVIMACIGKDLPITDDAKAIIDSLEAVCTWWSYGCNKFPDLGVSAKEMSKKIKELYFNLLPF